MKHDEENSNAPEKEPEQFPQKDEKNIKQQTIRRLIHSEELAESNRLLGIVNPSTNLEKRLESEDRDGSSIFISFIKNH